MRFVVPGYALERFADENPLPDGTGWMLEHQWKGFPSGVTALRDGIGKALYRLRGSQRSRHPWAECRYDGDRDPLLGAWGRRSSRIHLWMYALTRSSIAICSDLSMCHLSAYIMARFSSASGKLRPAAFDIHSKPFSSDFSTPSP